MIMDELGIRIIRVNTSPGPIDTPIFGSIAEEEINQIKAKLVAAVPIGRMGSPDEIAGAAPLLCAGITTYLPMRHWGVTRGKKVGVVGLGGLGNMAIKYAHAFRAHDISSHYYSA